MGSGRIEHTLLTGGRIQGQSHCHLRVADVGSGSPRRDIITDQLEAEETGPESFAKSERFVASESEVEFVSVSKSYTATGARWWGRRRTSLETVALRDVSFLVRKAEIVGLVGRNGAGKSTLLRLACGILRPSSGRILFLGQDPARYNARILKKLGFVMGARSRLIWGLPAHASFQLHKEIYGIGKRQYLDSLSHLNGHFDIEDLLPRTVRDLSLGQRMLKPTVSRGFLWPAPGSSANGPAVLRACTQALDLAFDKPDCL